MTFGDISVFINITNASGKIIDSNYMLIFYNRPRHDRVRKMNIHIGVDLTDF